MDARALEMLKGKTASKAVSRKLTQYSVDNAQAQFAAWTALEEMLTVKFIDGNIKPQDADGNFLHSKYYDGMPDKIEQPGYTEKWKESVVRDNGAVLEYK